MLNKCATKTALSQNLHRIMEKRGTSKMELSFDARLPYSRIVKILTCSTRDPQVSTVKALATALEVSIDDLVAEP